MEFQWNINRRTVWAVLAWIGNITLPGVLSEGISLDELVFIGAEFQ